MYLCNIGLLFVNMNEIKIYLWNLLYLNYIHNVDIVYHSY